MQKEAEAEDEFIRFSSESLRFGPVGDFKIEK